MLKKLGRNKIWSWIENDKKIVQKIKEDMKNLPHVYLAKHGDKLNLETNASDKLRNPLKAIPTNSWKEEVSGYTTGKFSKAEELL